MDPQILSAAIGGIATIAAVVVGWWLHEKKAQDSDSQLANLPSPAARNSRHLSAVTTEQRSPSRQPDGLSPITVKEIVESINSSPPFQKDITSKQYNGIKVMWVGYLKDASEDFQDKESVRVNLTINPDTSIGYSFWFTEKLSRFPQIRTLKQDSRICVTGEVISASGGGLCVVLRPISIEVMHDS